MKFHKGVFALLKIACVLFYLTGCAGHGGTSTFTLSESGIYSTISISPDVPSMMVGTSQTFTATTTNSDGAPTTWSLLTANAAPGAVGTLSATTGNTVTYTAPATPPIYAYSGPTVVQGCVYLGANVSPPIGYVSSGTSMVICITAPSVTVGLSPATATVPLGGNLQFTGYAVGSVNSGLTWQVEGFTGGSTAYGTIQQTSLVYPYSGLYTAPAVMPMTGPAIAITMISQADPTKTQTAVITLH